MKFLVLFAAVLAVASAGNIGYGYAAAPVAVAHAPLAVAAHAPVATSYANVNAIRHTVGVSAAPVAVAHAPIAVHAAPVATVGVAGYGIGHGIGYGLH